MILLVIYPHLNICLTLHGIFSMQVTDLVEPPYDGTQIDGSIVVERYVNMTICGRHQVLHAIVMAISRVGSNENTILLGPSLLQFGVERMNSLCLP